MLLRTRVFEIRKPLDICYLHMDSVKIPIPSLVSTKSSVFSQMKFPYF